MKKLTIKNKRYIQRKRRVRAKVFGTQKRPRLSVFRSLKHIYAQIIDDENGKTLASASDKEIKKAKEGNKVSLATLVGEEVAKKAVAKKIKKVVFDKGGSRFHGRVKAVADGARSGGLEF